MNRALGTLLDEEQTAVLLLLKGQLSIQSLTRTLCSVLVRAHHIRSIYHDDWIRKYLDYDFYVLFRMCKNTFVNLLRFVQCPELDKLYRGGGVPLTSEKALLMTLWWLGKGDSMLSISDRFDVAVSTVHHYTNIVLDRLVDLIIDFIIWPNEEEMETVESQFRVIAGYPGVIGAIDGCNIAFKAPIDQQDSYIDKNDKHSIKLQAVTTATRIFTNINIGFPGSVHDARIFGNSQLYVNCQNHLNNFFPREEFHLLGDKAYPLLGWLITPFKEYGNLTRKKRIHNMIHSKTRIKVEHTFGIWKGRWRILKYVNVNCPKKACKIIAATCVLHNFCYKNSDYWQEENYLDLDHTDGENEDRVIFVRNENIGFQKRQNIANSFI